MSCQQVSLDSLEVEKHAMGASDCTLHSAGVNVPVRQYKGFVHAKESVDHGWSQRIRRAGCS